MQVTIAPYSGTDTEHVKRFNKRLRDGGAAVEHCFSETPLSHWLPPRPGSTLYNEFFLAWDGDAVRGAYALKHQDFLLRGKQHSLTFFHHPLGEGIVDRKFSSVGLHLLMNVMRTHPLLFALGMGGYDRPLPKMLMALKWEHCAIPFYFRVIRPAPFLRNIQILRQKSLNRILLDMFAASGAGWLGLKAREAFAGRSSPNVDAASVPEFGDWADDLWDRCSSDYAMIGVRDASTLRALYPASNGKFIRIKVSRAGAVVGWAVLADVQKNNDPQYGNMRVGTILDCLAHANYADSVIAAATSLLAERGVDLIISNQSHREWQSAMKNCNFMNGPSNFIFAASKQLSELIRPLKISVPLSHINRGDGDSLLQYC